jgi:DNA-binding MarR family transcriptional regulator
MITNEFDENLLAMREDNIGRLLQRAARAYSERAVELLQRGGFRDISLFHTMLISHLDINGTRLTALADRAGMTKQAMGQIASDLEQKSYVVRMKDPADNRAALICFTDKGKEALRAAYQVKLTIEAECERAIGRKNMKSLQDLLTAIVDGGKPKRAPKDSEIR